MFSWSFQTPAPILNAKQRVHARQSSNVTLRLDRSSPVHCFEMSTVSSHVFVEYGSSSEMPIERETVTSCELQTSTQSFSPMSRWLKCFVLVSRTSRELATTTPHNPESRTTGPSIRKPVQFIGTTTWLVRSTDFPSRL